MLLKLGLNCYHKGFEFLVSTIYKLYYCPDRFISLINIYRLVANDYDVSTDKVRSSIRHTLEALNSDFDLYKDIFGNCTELSPRSFIENFMMYLQNIKSKE